MPNKIHLKVLLPVDRNLSGTLTVTLNGQDVQTFEVLGRGSAGPGDTQFSPNGNTPTGTWKGTGWASTTHQSQASYGGNGKLLLEPVDGDAKIATKVFLRDLFRIHGGSLGAATYWRGEGALRATHGCLRMSNQSMDQLYQTILTSMETSSGTCENPDVTVTVKEGLAW